MTDDALPTNARQAADRRATDAMPLKFKGAAPKTSAFPENLPADDEIETINIDAVLPPGSERGIESGAPPTEPPRTSLTAVQRAHQLQLIAFKESFAEFAFFEGLSRIDAGNLKRGDVVAIKTIVGSIYLRIVDRIKERRTQAGQILCDCYYDLGDASQINHTASIELPICAHHHVIHGIDGSKRQASRKLKITTDAELSAKLEALLDERFIEELGIYSNPQPEKLRAIDCARWIGRILVMIWRVIAWVIRKIKALIDENNRREKEKQRLKAEAREMKKQAKEAEREARRQNRG